jgi:hypothetical protein
MSETGKIVIIDRELVADSSFPTFALTDRKGADFLVVPLRKSVEQWGGKAGILAALAADAAEQH